MSFPSSIYGPDSERFNTYTAERWPLGTILMLQDGRQYRFGRNGGVAAVAGRMYQSEVPDSDHDTLAVPSSTTNAVGSRSLVITNGADVVERNLYKEGYAVTEAAAGAGEGRAYKIDVAHDELAASVDITIPLAAGSGLQVALNTSDKVTLVKHPMADVVIATAPPTAAVIGIAASPHAIAGFGWFQIRGPCACFVIGTHVIGGSVSPVGTVTGTPPGSLEATGVIITTADPTVAQYTEIVNVGICMEVAPTGDYGMVLLHMA